MPPLENMEVVHCRRLPTNEFIARCAAAPTLSVPAHLCPSADRPTGRQSAHVIATLPVEAPAKVVGDDEILAATRREEDTTTAEQQCIGTD